MSEKVVMAHPISRTMTTSVNTRSKSRNRVAAKTRSTASVGNTADMIVSVQTMKMGTLAA